jgi:hypothetical protein
MESPAGRTKLRVMLKEQIAGQRVLGEEVRGDRTTRRSPEDFAIRRFKLSKRSGS